MKTALKLMLGALIIVSAITSAGLAFQRVVLLEEFTSTT